MLNSHCGRCGSEEASYDWRGKRWLCADCTEEESYDARQPCPDVEDLDERCGCDQRTTTEDPHGRR